jgi:hypothetical protein
MNPTHTLTSDSFADHFTIILSAKTLYIFLSALMRATRLVNIQLFHLTTQVILAYRIPVG